MFGRIARSRSLDRKATEADFELQIGVELNDTIAAFPKGFAGLGSSEPFFAEALAWFGLTADPNATIYAKVDLLLDQLRREPVLLILDGVEPMQEPSGEVRNPALRLAQSEAGQAIGNSVAAFARSVVRYPGALNSLLAVWVGFPVGTNGFVSGKLLV